MHLTVPCMKRVALLQLELGEAKGQLRAAKAASAAAYERVEVLAAQLASVEGVSPLGLILRPSRVRVYSSTCSGIQ